MPPGYRAEGQNLRSTWWRGGSRPPTAPKSGAVVHHRESPVHVTSSAAASTTCRSSARSRRGDSSTVRTTATTRVTDTARPMLRGPAAMLSTKSEAAATCTHPSRRRARIKGTSRSASSQRVGEPCQGGSRVRDHEERVSRPPSGLQTTHRLCQPRFTRPPPRQEMTQVTLEPPVVDTVPGAHRFVKPTSWPPVSPATMSGRLTPA